MKQFCLTLLIWGLAALFGLAFATKFRLISGEVAGDVFSIFWGISVGYITYHYLKQ